MYRVISSLLILSLAWFNTLSVVANPPAAGQQAAAASGAAGAAALFNPAEFNQLREEAYAAVYNMEYAAARERFEKMVKLAPDHPAGYVGLANNLWIETLNASRRLSTSVYTSQSFYEQEAEADQGDLKRDREFNELIKKAVAASKARLQKDPQDVDALFYNGAALGLRAGYSVSVNRSFRKAIGDANESVKLQRRVIKVDPNYTDAYLSIGLYEYVVDSLPFVWRTLARLAGIKGSKKRGLEQLQMVVERSKYSSDDARVVLIGLYSREGQPERALEIISFLTTKYPRNYLLGLERAVMLNQMSRRDEAERAFADMLKNEAVAQTLTDLVNYYWAEGAFAAGDYAVALEHYRAAIRWPKAAKGLVTLAHLNTGRALDLLNKREEAVAEYQTVLKRDNVFDSKKLASQYVKKPYAKTDS